MTSSPAPATPTVVVVQAPASRPVVQRVENALEFAQRVLPTMPSLLEEQHLESPFNPRYSRDRARRVFDQVPVFPRYARQWPTGTEYAYYLPAGVLVEFPLYNEQVTPRQAAVGGWVIVKIPLKGKRVVSPVLLSSEQVMASLSPIELGLVTPVAVTELAPEGWWDNRVDQPPTPLWVYGAGFREIGD
jgi:hypothetical protein